MKFYKKLASLIIVLSMIMSASVTGVNAGTVGGVTFPDVSASALNQELAPVIQKGHPFIIANSDSFDRVRENAFGKDEVITNQYKLIKSYASSLLDAPLLQPPSDTTNSTYVGTAMAFYDNVMELCFVWRVEHDARYAQRAWEQVQLFCNMPSWGSYQLMDNVQVVFGTALCYDWLYDWLSNEQKNILINALNNKHFTEMSALYDDRYADRFDWTFYRATFAYTNQGTMINVLSFLGAMAIAETNMDFYTDIMAHALKNLEGPFSMWYPDSGWYEGVGYWGYTAPYMARLFITMKNSFGHCFGYENIPCLMNAADFPIYAQSSNGAFVFNDMTLDVDQRYPVIYCFGILKNDLSLQKFALDNAKTDSVGDAMFCLSYIPSNDYSVEYNLPRDKFFSNNDVITMRSSWDTTQETFAAMVVQEARAKLGMMNSGSVALDALGERWIMNHGKEVYYDGYWDFDGSRWEYYSTRAEANSCLVIDPSEDGGQNIDSKDTIDIFESGTDAAYAISDLTETYEDYVSSYKRGVGLFNNRRTFVVQDEFQIAKKYGFITQKKDVYSFFNIYKADIQIQPDGKSAIISKGAKKLYMTVDSDKSFTMSVMDSVPLPTSPTPSHANSDRSDFKKIALFFDSISSANIRVCFTPYICDEELAAINCSEYVAMSSWSVNGASVSVPKLQGIKINGTSLNGFNSETRYYEVLGDFSSSTVTAVADVTLYSTEVRKNNDAKTYTIVVTDKSNSAAVNSYVVDLSANTCMSTPELTYTSSLADDVMMPQEFYRIENGKDFSALYLKDTAPSGCVKAVLTLYAKPWGHSFNTALKGNQVSLDCELRELSKSKSPISSIGDLKTSLSADTCSVYGNEMTKLQYDITALLPANGGDYTIALSSMYSDTDYLTVASQRNSDLDVRPQIQYYFEN